MLDILCKSAVRRKIIGLFAINPEQRLYARQVAREIRESPHAVGLELKALVVGGVLARADLSGRICFSWNAAYPYAESLQQIVKRMREAGNQEMRSLASIGWRQELQRELDKTVEEIITKYDPEKILVFGSMVTGHIHQWSDIDLVVIKKSKLPFFKRVMILIDLLSYTVDIDLLVYTPEEVREAIRTNAFIREEIFERGKVLYDKAA
jgi:uncharacterized protein